MLRVFQAYKPASDRLAIHLLMLAMPHPPTDCKSLIISKTRQTLAEELELSVKTINRCLGILRGDGYLTILHGKIHIENKHLEKMSHTYL